MSFTRADVRGGQEDPRLRRGARDARAGALQGRGRAAWVISTDRMVGVILAAGKGARMYPFSERSPKPILPILNRPLLAHQIEVMRDCGITDIHIVVGHLGYQVASAFGDGVAVRRAHPVRRAGEHARPGARGRRARVARAAALPADARRHLLPSEGAAAAALRAGAVAAQVNANLVSMYEPDPEMVRRNFVIQADERGRVHRVIEKPRYVDSQLKGCGLYVFDPHIFDAIRRTPRTAMRDEYEITDSIQILINDGYVVHHHPIVERDLNLTKPDDLLTINLIELGAARPAAAGRRPRDRRPTARASSAASSATAWSSAIPIRIANSVIMPNVVVDAATRPRLGGDGRRALGLLPRRRRAGVGAVALMTRVCARARHRRRRLHRIAPDARAARAGPPGHRPRQPVGRPPRGRAGRRALRARRHPRRARRGRRARRRRLRLSPRGAGHHPRQLRSLLRGSRHQRDGHGAAAAGGRSGGACKWFVLASSMAVYADADAPAPIDETHPTQPLSPYGIGKLAAEGVARQILGGARHSVHRGALLQHVRPGSDLHAVCRRHHDLRDAAAPRRGADRSSATASSSATSCTSTTSSRARWRRRGARRAPTTSAPGAARR